MDKSDIYMVVLLFAAYSFKLLFLGKLTPSPEFRGDVREAARRYCFLASPRDLNRPSLLHRGGRVASGACANFARRLHHNAKRFQHIINRSCNDNNLLPKAMKRYLLGC